MSRPSPLLRRGLIFSLSIIAGALASAIWANLLFSIGITGFDVIQIVLFVPGILWVSVFFWSEYEKKVSKNIPARINLLAL